ncbi:MAG: hypothetical protein BV456_10345 [Thermoplasmata archaeon M8B2D]|nr:MAG: hypothetical protein BV456_10345 [Thermoplasmata archaeon M8B2D]
MAGRKDKNTIDYFPHYVNHGKTLFIIESKYKSDGYTTWFKILETLGKSENHFIDCRNTEDMEYLRAKIPLMQSNLEDIINSLASLGAIHKELWENKIIWSGNFIKEIEDVYNRRNNKCLHFYDLCEHISIKCKHKYSEYGIIDNGNTQSKVKESKVKESTTYDLDSFIDYGKIENTYKLHCENLSQIKKLSDSRKKHINARFKEFDLDTIISVIEKVGKSNFLNGDNKRKWKADFDWIFNPTNFVKILEGKYDNKAKSKPEMI